MLADSEGERRMPQMRIARCGRRVGPDQRRGGGNQQDDAADRFYVEETLEGVESSVGQALRGRQRPSGMVSIHEVARIRLCGGPTDTRNLSGRTRGPDTRQRPYTNEAEM
ncbi:hypothetical protein ACFS3C_04750 [Azotobacter vinelandii]